MRNLNVRQNLRALELAFGGERFLADCAGALYWPDERTLIVSDLHFEKASFFASRGVMLPPYDTATTLDALARLIVLYEPSRVIALGDSFHDSAGGTRLSPENRAFLLSLQAGREWIWITGNHDPERIEQIGGEFCENFSRGDVVFRHQPGDGAFEIVGHFHPAARVSVRGRSLRRRCFASSDRKLVLPAFGSLTGGFNIRDVVFSTFMGGDFFAHMLATEQVFSFAAANCLPD
ncbi:MAG: ligase-associated DNA damage response endonuclease PdeM [Xanthobacteraceae bacterium]|nr:ligase-associated DNA damage response endonuclease PdeM [Xanthobacteraceae bacterium]